jgi:CelD/BcsL family acetyltransferase involved in cellulose biosynthesis
MQIDLYRDPAVFAQLAPEWNSLLERGVTRVPFLRAEYQGAWWAGRGGGEWPATAELLVAAGRGAEGELLGVAPLFHAVNRDGRPALLLVGGVEISDYLDFVVARSDAEAFCTSLLERLAAPDVPAWEVLDLYNVPANSPTRTALARAASARGWTAGEQLLQPVPAITLPDDWETYLATMVEKKERQEIRRKMRRAEGGEDKVTWRIIDGGAGQDVDAASEAFMALMTHNADKANFLTAEMRRQFGLIVRVMAEQGWLLLAFLEVNGEKAAAYLNFDYGNRLWVYNSAIDPRFNALSPGWVLLGHLLKWAIEHKRQAFDFLRGDEDYKFRFGAVAGKIYRLQASRAAPLEALGGEPACMMNEFEADFFPEGED